MNNLQAIANPINWKRLLDKPRIYVDLNSGGRVGDSYIALLDSSATWTDLRERQINLEEGLTLDFWTDDGTADGNPDSLVFQGVVHFDEGLGQWTAVTDWNGFSHVSDHS